ncbi:viridiflorene synthase-like [Dorcoceras hygrometricum]|uniref:Viridiflorene synthase-like n=1 Tax=Dorcoceras hygrometricum TaxID=472368 RepID=A0A2Z7CHK0_9LAMI|nr:viridiflorene synthase-like [Dorcoceras hygrometricum]
MVMSKESKITDKMLLIDNIERLGLSYHFETEIEEQVEQIFHESSGSNFKAMENYDLFNTALLFRLFRQHGHYIPCDVFDKFKDTDNPFLTTLESDINGLLSFYEATDVRIQGENVLEEAVAFTTYHLNGFISQTKTTDFPLREKVSQALKNSVHRGVPILVARYYIPIYEKEESRNELLVRLAILNFCQLQNLYQKELSDLTRWWKDLDLISKVPYMRGRLVEAYFWGLGFNYEPQYFSARSAIVKAIVYMTMLDDTYDTFAPLEDLEILTRVLQRGEMNEMDRLPDYLKEVCKCVSIMREDFDNEASKNGKHYAGSYYKEAVKELYMAYHTEANWYRRNRLPRFEHLHSLGVITSTLFALTAASFLSGPAEAQDFQWLMSKPKIAVDSALLCRYWNDVASYQREKKINGESMTSVDCYMKQYAVSEEEALKKFLEVGEDMWMSMNKEWMKTDYSKRRHCVKPVLNYARVAILCYGSGVDGYTYPEQVLKPHILALLEDPLFIIS